MGAQGYVPAQTDGVAELNFGEEGVLTDPGADTREWIRCYLYDDGELVFTAAASHDTGRGLLASGRLCAQAHYNTTGYQPWDDVRNEAAHVTFAADMSSCAYLNMDYWFYGHQEIASVAGLTNLHGVREMRYTFASCDGLASLDFSGFDESNLEDLFYCFSGCGNLTTIYADADWQLPAGCTGAS
mgnify:CR=1 FL=1